MPREQLDIEPSLERISVLDESGAFDEELAPDVDDETQVSWLRAMILARRFDARLLDLQRQGRIGTFAPVEGQEASQIGAVSAIGDDDWFVPSYRETGAALWRGWDLVDITVFNAGWNEGVKIPDDARDLPMAVPVASQLPHAAGLAYGARFRGTDEVVMTFFGDGATSEGDFHEALNFAGTFRLPAVFVCENNQWAISVPRERQTASETLAQKALAYGVPGVQVDGNDVLAVHLAAKEAVERARAGEGPTLVECVTYRMGLHTTADDPTRYRNEEEVEAWREKDPIRRFRDHLVDRGVLSEDDVQQMESEIDERMEGIWDRVEERIAELGGPEEMFEHMYAELTPELEAQREEVKARVGAGAGAEDDLGGSGAPEQSDEGDEAAAGQEDGESEDQREAESQSEDEDPGDVEGEDEEEREGASAAKEAEDG